MSARTTAPRRRAGDLSTLATWPPAWPVVAPALALAAAEAGLGLLLPLVVQAGPFLPHALYGQVPLPEALDRRPAVQRDDLLGLAGPVHEGRQILPALPRQPPVLDHAGR